MQRAVILVCAACGAAAPTTTSKPPPPPPTPVVATHPVHLDEVRPPRAGGAKPAPILDLMTAELKRSLGALKKHADPPYYAAYEVTDNEAVTVTASDGVLDGSSDVRGRWADIDVRVGDYKLDNTHRNARALQRSQVSASLPLDDDAYATTSILWAHTDQAYKRAAEQLAKVEASSRVTAKEDDPSDDFSHETPGEYFESPAQLSFDRKPWEQRLRALSAAFVAHPEILHGSVALQIQAETRYFVNDEGTRYQIPRLHFRVMIAGSTHVDDGMELHRHEIFDVATADKLPSDDEIKARIGKVIADLDALRAAPVAEPYSGPAILEGQAASVFFHEVFGHRIEGHRQKDEQEGQTFSKKVGEHIMPDFISVYDDPSIATLDGVDLNGFYREDDEGVPGQKASLVENGVLETFLLGRSPTRGFTTSNGHGRRQAGHASVARQGNLIVEPSRTVDPKTLRAMLLDEVKTQGKPYGLIFRELDGGFTMTERYLPQSFKLLPIMVVRLYPDGHEELVRGADLEGTPLAALSNIEAAADDIKTFNGFCGAESGFVPVSSSAPSLLISHVEVAKKEQSRDKPPILGAPTAASGEGEAMVRAMRDEIARAMDKLELPRASKPYYVGMSGWDMRWANVDAAFGSITHSQEYPHRSVDLDVRVGDYSFDSGNAQGDRPRTATLPMDDDYYADRHALWLAIDGAYKHATQALERKQAVAKEEVKSEEVASFSKEPALHVVDEAQLAPFDMAALEGIAKKLSAVFRTNPDVFTASVHVTAAHGHHYVVTSEGTSAKQPVSFIKIHVDCTTQASDGMPLHGSLNLWAPAVGQLPAEADMVAAVDKLSKEMSERRKAAIVDDYGGPILFTGIAADQALRALLAENLAGTPAPKSDRPGGREPLAESELAGKLNVRILPLGVTLTDDPTIKAVGKAPVIAAGKFDEEGVATQKVTLVENGTFKRFLMSRTPRRGADRSNGHGYSTPFSGFRAHPSNLYLSSTKAVSDAEVKKRAIAAAKDEGLTYVLVVERFDEGGEDVEPGATLPHPAVMKKLYADGKEELVRGGTLGSITLRSLRDILAAGNAPVLYHYFGQGFPGVYDMLGESSSGFIGSIAAPSLLFRDADVKKPTGSQKAPPIAGRP